MIESVASFAPISPPETGASTAYIPLFLASSYILTAKVWSRCSHVNDICIRFSICNDSMLTQIHLFYILWISHYGKNNICFWATSLGVLPM